MPSEAGKPASLKEGRVTLTRGKTIRIARASLATGGLKEAIGIKRHIAKANLIRRYGGGKPAKGGDAQYLVSPIA